VLNLYVKPCLSHSCKDQLYNDGMKNVFPERFKAERLRAGLTLDQIAEVCVNRDGETPSRAAIIQWQKPDGTRPTFENLVAAARRMNTSIDYLVGLTDNPKKTIGLSKSAIEIASTLDKLSPDARRTVLSCLNWAIEMEKRKEKDSMTFLRQILKNVMK
jgi:transcriptional regulator with XRE-family HTH domain